MFMQTQSLKSDTVLFLTDDTRTQLDRQAAKLFAGCELKLQRVSPEKERGHVRVDVMIHGEPARIGQLHKSDAAGRIENAIREVSGTPIRRMQWVEEVVDVSPRGPRAADSEDEAGGVGSGEPPKYRNDRPTARNDRDQRARHVPGSSGPSPRPKA